MGLIHWFGSLTEREYRILILGTCIGASLGIVMLLVIKLYS